MEELNGFIKDAWKRISGQTQKEQAQKNRDKDQQVSDLDKEKNRFLSQFSKTYQQVKTLEADNQALVAKIRNQASEILNM